MASASSDGDKLTVLIPIYKCPGGGDPFKNFEEQSIAFADYFWPGWNESDTTKSRIVPPVFYHNNEDVSDNDIQKMEDDRKNEADPKMKPPEIARFSDKGEQIVYEAIQQIISENIPEVGPFIAFHSLDISTLKDTRKLNAVFPGHVLAMWWEIEKLKNKKTEIEKSMNNEKVKSNKKSIEKMEQEKIKVETSLQELDEQMKEAMQNLERSIMKSIPSDANPDNCCDLKVQDLLPKLDQCFREYDFILIGPSIGIVNIEVKSHKSAGNAIGDGLNQLESTHYLIHFLETCGIILPPDWRCDVKLRKILFTPDLEESLINRNTVPVEHWGKGKMANMPEHNDKVGLYSALRNFLINTPLDQRISMEFYKAYTPILAGLSSVLVTPTAPNNKYDLDEAKYSEIITASEQGTQIGSQFRILKGNKNNDAKLTEGSTLEIPKMKEWEEDVVDKKKLENEIKKKMKLFRRDLNVYFLTPDQKLALSNSSQYQIIVGGPGTGKTLVLYAKLWNLRTRIIQDDCQKKILRVMTPESYREYYKSLLADWGFSYPSCKASSFVTPAIFKHTTKHLIEQIDKGEIKTPHELLTETKKYWQLENIDKIFPLEFGWISRYEYLIFDDIFDEEPTTDSLEFAFFTPFLWLELMKLKRPNTKVWIAGDPVKGLKPGQSFKYYELVVNLMRDLMDKKSDTYANNCSITPLRQVMRCSGKIFEDAYGMIEYPEWLKPTLGHKIMSANVMNIQIHGSTIDDAKDRLCEHLRQEFLDQNKVTNATERKLIGIVIDTIDQTLTAKIQELIEEPGFEKLQVKLLSWDNASSLEWSTVIFITFYPSNTNPEPGVLSIISHEVYGIYRKYRAITRGMAKAFIYHVTT